MSSQTAAAGLVVYGAARSGNAKHRSKRRQDVAGRVWLHGCCSGAALRRAVRCANHWYASAFFTLFTVLQDPMRCLQGSHAAMRAAERHCLKPPSHARDQLVAFCQQRLILWQRAEAGQRIVAMGDSSPSAAAST